MTVNFILEITIKITKNNHQTYINENYLINDSIININNYINEINKYNIYIHTNKLINIKKSINKSYDDLCNNDIIYECIYNNLIDDYKYILIKFKKISKYCNMNINDIIII